MTLWCLCLRPTFECWGELWSNRHFEKTFIDVKSDKICWSFKGYNAMASANSYFVFLLKKQNKTKKMFIYMWLYAYSFYFHMNQFMHNITAVMLKKKARYDSQ